MSTCARRAGNQFLIDLGIPASDRELIEYKVDKSLAVYSENAPTSSLTSIVDAFSLCVFKQADEIVTETLTSTRAYVVIMCLLLIILTFLIIYLQSWGVLLIYVFVALLLTLAYVTGISNSITSHTEGLERCRATALASINNYSSQQESAINAALCTYASL